MTTSPTNSHLWQLKIFFATVQHFSKQRNTLISNEIITSMQQQILSLLDGWELELFDNIKNYLLGEMFVDNFSVNQCQKLACYLNFYDVPFRIFGCDKNMNGLENNFLYIFDKLSSDKSLSSVTINKVIELLSK